MVFHSIRSSIEKFRRNTALFLPIRLIYAGMKSSLIIATRESPLALRQAEQVKSMLEASHPDLSVSLLGLTTSGDRLLDTTLVDVGGKALFVKELEEALLDGRADLAVHSAKDLPMHLPAGLTIAAFCQRENPYDVLVSEHYDSLLVLPRRGRVGTASLRRQSQLRQLRPDLQVSMLRGNIQTRLAKLEQNAFDAIVLAAAGLIRMQLTARIQQIFSVDEMMPAAGQGILALECREEDMATRALLAPLADQQATWCIAAERALSERLGGSCHAPIGAYAEYRQGDIILQGFVGSLDGKQSLRADGRAPAAQSVELGYAVAEQLLQQGAATILAAIGK